MAEPNGSSPTSPRSWFAAATTSRCSPAANSITSAELVGCVRVALRLDPHASRPHPLLHDDARPRPPHGGASSTSCISTSTICTSRCSATLSPRAVTTLHGRQDLPDRRRSTSPSTTCRWSRSPTTSASRCRRRQFRRHDPSRPAARPLMPAGAAAAAAISPSSAASRRRRGPDRAIEIAKRPASRSRSRPRSTRSTSTISTRVVKPLLDDPLVEFIGEIGEHEKQDFLGNALALLFPIDWPEPFGLVHDRGDGLRHAGHRLQPRLGAGGDRAGRHRAPSSRTSTKPPPRSRRSPSSTARRSGRRFEQRFTAAKMAEEHIQTLPAHGRRQRPAGRAAGGRGARSAPNRQGFELSAIISGVVSARGAAGNAVLHSGRRRRLASAPHAEA